MTAYAPPNPGGCVRAWILTWPTALVAQDRSHSKTELDGSQPSEYRLAPSSPRHARSLPLMALWSPYSDSEAPSLLVSSEAWCRPRLCPISCANRVGLACFIHDTPPPTYESPAQAHPGVLSGM